MLEFEETDFQPLDSFTLKWRWTDSRWNKLPDDALENIRPLSSSKARELCQYSMKFSPQFGVIGSAYQCVSRLDTSIEELAINQWLLEHFTDANQTVVVSWDKNLAALVRGDVFCDYWSDFCYPASDDVTIWPLAEDWALKRSR